MAEIFKNKSLIEINFDEISEKVVEQQGTNNNFETEMNESNKDFESELLDEVNIHFLPIYHNLVNN
jgi:hypothetical protein